MGLVGGPVCSAAAHFLALPLPLAFFLVLVRGFAMVAKVCSGRVLCALCCVVVWLCVLCTALYVYAHCLNTLARPDGGARGADLAR